MPNYDGVPAGLVIEVEMAPSTWIDVSDYVERSSFKVEWSTDRYASRLSFKLDKRGGGTFSGHAIADWQRIRVYDTAHAPPGLPVGAYTRYFYGFTQILASDNPLGVDKAWNITCVDMAALLTQGPYAITTLWPDIDGSPAGISDRALLWDGFTISGVPYNGLIPSYAPDLYTTRDISIVISSLPHLKFENMTVLDAINLIKGQASSTQAPRFYVTIADDWYDGITHFDHENWNPLFSWFDESSIGYSAPINELTDALTLTGGQAHWSTMSVNSDGTRVINQQTVSGDLESQATVNDTASQTAYGRIITGKPVVDTSLKTNDECTAKAQAFINAFKVARRTVQVTCYDQVSSAILRQPFKLKLTNALEGFSATDFAVVRASLQIDAAGVAYYAFDCGVSFIELSDTNLPSFVGGGSGLDLTPPPVPTGLVTLENVYEGQSHSSRWHIDWDDNSIVADFDRFIVDWYYFNGIWHHTQVATTVSNLNIPNLTPGQTYYAEVRALDTSGNTSHYCTPISVVAAAADVPAVPTGLTVLPYGPSVTGYGVKVNFTVPNTAPIASFAEIEFGTWTSGGGDAWVGSRTVNATPGTAQGVIIGPLIPGQYWSFHVRSVMANGVDHSAYCTTVRKIIGGSSVGVPPIPVPVDGIYTNPFVTDAAGLVGYTSTRVGAGNVLASSDYLWNGNASAKFGTSTGTDSATLTKLLEPVVPGVPLAWFFRENYASGAHGLWTVKAQEYAIDGTPGTLTTLYSGVPAIASLAGIAHTGRFLPAAPLVELSVKLGANGFSGALTAYMGDVGLRDGPPPGSDPPAPTGITFGTQDWDLNGVIQPITIILPAVHQASTRVKVYMTSNHANEIINTVINGNVTDYTLYAATRGFNYSVALTSLDSGQNESTVPFIDTFNALAESPPAPTAISIVQQGVASGGGTGGNNGYIKITFTGTTWPNLRRYQCVFTLQAGGAYRYQVDLYPVNGVWPTGGTLASIPTNRALRLNVYTEDAFGYSGPASANVDFSIGPTPSGQPPPIGETDMTAATDLPAGYVPDSPGAGTTPGWSATEVFLGKASLKSTLPASAVAHSWLSDPIAVQTGKGYKLMVARKATVASGTATVALRWYDKTDSLLSTDTVWSAAPTTGWVAIPDANQVVTAPAGAVYGRLLLRWTGTGTAGSIYWGVAEGEWQPQITPPAIAPNAVTSPAINPRAVLGTKQDLGIPAFMPDGSMEVGNDAGTFADGYTYTGTATWGTPASGDYEGTKAITLGGVAGAHTLTSPLAIWLTPAATVTRWLRMRWLDTTVGSGVYSAELVKGACYDSTGTLITTVGVHDATGGPFTWALSGSTVQEVFFDPAGIPAGTVYVGVRWEVTTTSTAAVVIDAVALDPVDTPVLTGLRLWDPAGGVLGVPGQVMTADSNSVGVWAAPTAPPPLAPSYQTAGFTVDPATATTYYLAMALAFSTASIALPPAVDWPGAVVTLYLEDPNNGTITVDSDIGGIGDHIYGSAALSLWAVTSIPLTNQGSTLTLESDGRDSGGGHGAPIAGWWVRDYIP